MKKIWYLFVKVYMRLGFAFYFKKVLVSGKENIPKDKAILFVCNHQNALIDPLLIGSICPRELHFLTRADIFNKPLVKAILASVNMLPIYRISDGIASVSKNDAVFEKCFKILNKRGTILIFPEGNHNIQRRLRILRKGFTRIVYGALEKDPSQEIFVVPIGINYTNAKKYASSVHLIFGEAIEVLPQHQQDLKIDAGSDLKNKVSEAMKKIITHIEHTEQHDAIATAFKEEDFLYPDKVNHKLEHKEYDLENSQETASRFHLLQPFIQVNSWITLMVWKRMYPKIVEEEFIATWRFTLGITLLPISYVLQAAIVAYFLGNIYGFSYLFLSFVIAYLYAKSK